VTFAPTAGVLGDAVNDVLVAVPATVSAVVAELPA
jgi:hypothetical protein